MKRFSVAPHGGFRRFGIKHPHELNRTVGFRGGERR